MEAFILPKFILRKTYVVQDINKQNSCYSQTYIGYNKRNQKKKLSKRSVLKEKNVTLLLSIIISHYTNREKTERNFIHCFSEQAHLHIFISSRQTFLKSQYSDTVEKHNHLSAFYNFNLLFAEDVLSEHFNCVYMLLLKYGLAMLCEKPICSLFFDIHFQCIDTCLSGHSMCCFKCLQMILFIKENFHLQKNFSFYHS